MHYTSKELRVILKDLWRSYLIHLSTLKLHSGHEFISIEDAYQDVWEKIKSTLLQNNSTNLLINSTGDIIEKCKEIGNFVILNKANSYIQKINQISTELIVKNEEKIDDFEHRRKHIISQQSTIEKKLLELKYSEDKSKVVEMIECLNEDNFYIKEAWELNKEIKDYLSLNQSIDIESSMKETFMVEVKKLIEWSQDLEFLLNINSFIVTWCLKFIDNSKWKILVKINNDKASEKLNVKIVLNHNNEKKLSNETKIHRIISDKNFHKIGKIIKIKDISSSDKILKFEIYLWKYSKNVSNYFSKTHWKFIEELEKLKDNYF